MIRLLRLKLHFLLPAGGDRSTCRSFALNHFQLTGTSSMQSAQPSLIRHLVVQLGGCKMLLVATERDLWDFFSLIRFERNGAICHRIFHVSRDRLNAAGWSFQ